MTRSWRTDSISLRDVIARSGSLLAPQKLNAVRVLPGISWERTPRFWFFSVSNDGSDYKRELTHAMTTRGRWVCGALAEARNVIFGCHLPHAVRVPMSFGVHFQFREISVWRRGVLQLWLRSMTHPRWPWQMRHSLCGPSRGCHTQTRPFMKEVLRSVYEDFFVVCVTFRVISCLPCSS